MPCLYAKSGFEPRPFVSMCNHSHVGNLGFSHVETYLPLTPTPSLRDGIATICGWKSHIPFTSFVIHAQQQSCIFTIGSLPLDAFMLCFNSRNPNSSNGGEPTIKNGISKWRDHLHKGYTLHAQSNGLFHNTLNHFIEHNIDQVPPRLTIFPISTWGQREDCGMLPCVYGVP